jgi:hypothetical protein
MEPGVGVHYLLVAGTVVVNEGKIVPDVFPAARCAGVQSCMTEAMTSDVRRSVPDRGRASCGEISGIPG